MTRSDEIRRAYCEVWMHLRELSIELCEVECLGRSAAFWSRLLTRAERYRNRVPWWMDGRAWRAQRRVNRLWTRHAWALELERLRRMGIDEHGLVQGGGPAPRFPPSPPERSFVQDDPLIKRARQVAIAALRWGAINSTEQGSELMDALGRLHLALFDLAEFIELGRQTADPDLDKAAHIHWEALAPELREEYRKKRQKQEAAQERRKKARKR